MPVEDFFKHVMFATDRDFLQFVQQIEKYVDHPWTYLYKTFYRRVNIKKRSQSYLVMDEGILGIMIVDDQEEIKTGWRIIEKL